MDMDNMNQYTVGAAVPEQKLLDENQVQTIAQALLNAAPPPRKLSKKETLDALAPDLKSAIERGHTTESMANVLLTNGLKVSARAITSALRSQTSGARARRAQAPKKLTHPDASNGTLLA